MSLSVGRRVRVMVEGKGWIGPASEQLHAREGVITDIDSMGTAAKLWGIAYLVKFDRPLDLGWRSIEAMWFVEEFLEVIDG